MSVHSHRMRRVFWRRRIVVVIILLACVVVGRSYAGALRGPGDGVAAKSAEWARDHRLGAIVTLAEEVQYRLHPPTTGGALSASSQQLLTGNQNGAAAATVAPSPAVRGKEVATQLPPIPSPGFAGTFCSMSTYENSDPDLSSDPRMRAPSTWSPNGIIFAPVCQQARSSTAC